jgi:cytoskeleton protein RodZ
VDALSQSRYLKSERLSRGLSLHEMARKAELSISLIRALEAGRFSEIGSPPLVLSHLQTYAQALADHQLNPVKTEAPQPATETPHPPGSTHVEFTSTPPGKKRFLGMAALLLIGVLALGALYQAGMISSKDQGLSEGRLPAPRTSPEPLLNPAPPPADRAAHDANANLEEPSTQTHIQTPPGDTSVGPLPDQGDDTGSPTTLSAKAMDHDESALMQPKSPNHNFEIEALQSSWVEVRCDGRKSEGVLLQAGERREWQVARELQILVGNAGGVQMKWDGSAVNIGGRPGQVLRFKLPHPELTGESP